MKQISVHLYRHEDRFYNRYINNIIKTKHIDDNGSGEETFFFAKTGIRCSFGYISRGKMWDRYLKITNHNFGRKRKPTGNMYLPRKKYREAEGHLNLRSCLQDSVIHSSPSIGRYINKLKLCNQFPPRILKYKNTSEIENTLCLIIVMNVNPVFQIEKEPCSAIIIVRKVNNGV